MQHSEISGTRDAIDAFRERLPRIFRGLLANANYEIIKRSILPTAKIHPTVKNRFALETVIDCAGDNVGAYRPEALRKHDDFKQFYPDPPLANAPPPGRGEEPELLTQLAPQVQLLQRTAGVVIALDVRQSKSNLQPVDRCAQD
jgi:hypothetical protein